MTPAAADGTDGPAAGASTAGGSTEGTGDEGLRQRANKVVSDAEGRALEAYGEVTARIDSRPFTARLYSTIRSVIAKQSGYRLSLSAAGSAFWLVIALFPATIAVIMVYGLVVDPTTMADDVRSITERSPDSLGAALAQQAEAVASSESGTVTVGLVISLIATLWSVSSGMYALTRAVRQAYGLAPQNYILARWRAFLGAIVAVIVLGLFIGVAAAYGSWHGHATSTEKVISYLIGVPLGTCVMAVTLAVLFRFSISERVPFRNLALGAGLGAVATMALIIGVALFGSYVSHYEQIYGTLTGIIVAMLGIYTMMYAILLCAVFNAEWRPLEADDEPQAASAPSGPAAPAEPPAP